MNNDETPTWRIHARMSAGYDKRLHTMFVKAPDKKQAVDIWLADWGTKFARRDIVKIIRKDLFVRRTR
jgi:hypothetical protein